jgi:predicted PhzF superfamily epimerase YddE/YHI9
VKIPDSLVKSLGKKPKEVLMGSQVYMAVFENENDIKEIKPDFGLMEKIDKAIIVTAKGNDPIDFVSRFFDPNVGIPEDPVTGFAHCALIPYWAEKLNKTDFQALQLSRRGGKLYCEYLGERVIIGGKAVTYSLGFINIQMKQ